MNHCQVVVDERSPYPSRNAGSVVERTLLHGSDLALALIHRIFQWFNLDSVAMWQHVARLPLKFSHFVAFVALLLLLLLLLCCYGNMSNTCPLRSVALQPFARQALTAIATKATKAP
jgi:hypothetical protein